MYPANSEDRILRNYEPAGAIYSGYGIDTDQVLARLSNIPLSLHCRQGDDVTGFEPGKDQLSGGGILTTGNYPGRARNGQELRADLDFVLSLIPGSHRVNLHAIYAETGGKKVERDQLNEEHFSRWISWAKERGIELDFNPTFFSHPLADDGFTLSSRDQAVRSFWIRHGKICREIAAEIGKELESACVNNLWIPDGPKDIPADRLTPRKILKDSLDEIYEHRYRRKYSD